MKSAYEIAMERLAQAGGGTKKLSEEQRARIADIEKRYEARIAETRVSHEGQAAAAAPEERAEILARMAEGIRNLEETRDREKNAVWEEA
ncbi:MAG TPA: hypothetical protein ENN65_03585 [Candidatus Hydrogenedentes bacterium]|nr:hypothetical protein [Candidatus Hydrogenedentota bacterium]